MQALRRVPEGSFPPRWQEHQVVFPDIVHCPCGLYRRTSGSAAHLVAAGYVARLEDRLDRHHSGAELVIVPGDRYIPAKHRRILQAA